MDDSLYDVVTSVGELAESLQRFIKDICNDESIVRRQSVTHLLSLWPDVEKKFEKFQASVPECPRLAPFNENLFDIGTRVIVIRQGLFEFFETRLPGKECDLLREFLVREMSTAHEGVVVGVDRPENAQVPLLVVSFPSIQLKDRCLELRLAKSNKGMSNYVIKYDDYFSRMWFHWKIGSLCKGLWPGGIYSVFKVKSMRYKWEKDPYESFTIINIATGEEETVSPYEISPVHNTNEINVAGTRTT